MKQSNFAPIEFKNEDFKLHRVVFKDEKDYQALKRDFRVNNTIFRQGDFIYCSNFEGPNPLEHGELIDVNINNNELVTLQLVHNLIFRRLYRNDLLLTDFNPIKFHVKNKNENIIKGMISEELASKIGFWKGYKIDTRALHVNGQWVYGAILNSFHEWKIKINCLDLLKKVSPEDLIGQYVTKYVEDHVLVGGKRLIGEVLDVTEKVAIVKGKEETLEYDLSEIFLENSYENRSILLDSLLGEKLSTQVTRYLWDKGESRNGAMALKRDVDYMVSALCGPKTFFSNTTGLTFKITKPINETDQLWKKVTVNKPVYIFNQHGNQQDYWHDRGLRNYGPYSKNNLHLKDNVPNIIVLGRRKTQGDITKFIGKLKDGLPQISTTGNSPYQPYGQGFIRKYHLNGMKISFYWVENESLDEYRRAITEIFEREESIDMAIIESQQLYKILPDSENPYLFTKSKFMAKEIPSQEVMYENMILPDRNLAYLLNNISLAIYAKLGGIPWIIPKDSNTDHEVVIGIGSKVFKKNRFEFDSRVVGITTFFSSSGDYLLSNTSKDVPFEDYLSELKQSLDVSIGKIRRKENWLKGDTVRLVFHVFKPFSDDEINVIEEMCENLKEDFNVVFAYLTFSEANQYKIFDDEQKGIQDPFNHGKYKGVGMVERSYSLKLSDNQALIQFIGPGELKSFNQGMASPVLMKLHRRSTFDSLDYLLRQSFTFACISWRGFLPSGNPVTLEYSNLIAKQLGSLRKSGHWNESIIGQSLRNKAWFL